MKGKGEKEGKGVYDDAYIAYSEGVPVDLLKFVGAKSVSIPEDQVVSDTVHVTVAMGQCHNVLPPPVQNVSDHLKKVHISPRLKSVEGGEGVNWATAEALAFGTLLHQGVVHVHWVTSSRPV